jgi:hypothetical protein
MKRTYHGSCHCKAVTFEADIDLDQGTGKCNCTFCWKQRMWNVGRLKPEDFRLLTGADQLADYGKSGAWGEGHHRFCSKCGIATHGHGRIDAVGGEFVSVHLAALDDLPVPALVAAPVHYMDGLHDKWQSLPAETRHL